MSADNPYEAVVQGYVDLLTSTRAAEQVPSSPGRRPMPAADAPKALIFAPHPDDECIIGGLPLRLLREAGMNVINVAVTQGSRKERQAERWRELEDACRYLGFGLLPTAENGLERINPVTREKDPAYWSQMVTVVAGILQGQRPQIIFMPHADDWNQTHIGTHYLLVDALARLGPDFSCWTVETEFWGAMATPNLLVESSTEDIAELIAALALHRGEVARNPYHIRFPAWLIDNVRRGAELVRGQGAAAPEFTFATLYRLRRWAGGRSQDVQNGGRLLGCRDDPAELFR